MRFALIDAEKAAFPVRTMCRVLDVSQSGFFAWKDRPASQRQRDDMVYLAHIRTAFELSRRTYGSPRMHRELVDEGLPIGRRRTARLMRENGTAEAPLQTDNEQRACAGWISQYRGDETPPEIKDDLQAELKRLRKDNAVLRQERDILKKAAAFFAKEGNR